MHQGWRVASIVAAIGLTACATLGARHPGRLVLIQTQPITSLDPDRQNGAVAQELAALLHRYLLSLNPSGDLVPDAAVEVPTRANGGISPDGRTITYHIRPGLLFSDGRSLDARDVVGTLAAARAKSSRAMSRMGLDLITRVWAPSAHTVRVSLRRPYAAILLYLCAPGSGTPILPAADAAALIDTRAPRRPTIGAGPYRVNAFRAGEILELLPNPHYSPRATLASLDLLTVQSSNTARVQLETGEADGYVMADPGLEPQLAAIPRLRLTTTPIDGVGAIIFNTADPTTGDLRVRRAIASAINIPGDLHRVFHNAISTTDAGRGLFLWSYDRGSYRLPVHSVSTAEQELDRAGWRKGANGIRSRAGRALTLSVIVRSDQSSSSRLATEFAQELEGIGIEVTLRQYPIDVFGAANGPLYGGHFQIAVAQFITGFDPDVSDQFGCDRIPPHGYNKSRYCNPHLDAILRKAASHYEPSLRIPLYARAQRILARDLPIVPLYRLTSLDALSERLSTTEPAPTTPFWNAASWHFVEQKK